MKQSILILLAAMGLVSCMPSDDTASSENMRARPRLHIDKVRQLENHEAVLKKTLEEALGLGEHVTEEEH